ncbi:hypothetical protein F5884DRAFT_100958 [Xylogone sp. PMI_703]|nr:hypothetical protein F5884DRAFT_100958 [Xylogone sp. PMI_703]
MYRLLTYLFRSRSSQISLSKIQDLEAQCSRVLSSRQSNCRETAPKQSYSRQLKLPPELIRCVTDFLPPESSAALSLTCRYLYEILKEKYLEPLKKDENRHSRYAFAVLLASALPDRVACFHCKRYHLITPKTISRHIIYSRSKYGLPACARKSYIADLTNSFMSNYFNPIIFRMLMKEYQNNRPYQGLLKHLSSKELTIGPVNGIIWTYFYAKIHGNRLLVRCQTINMPSSTDTYTQGGNRCRRVCPHISMLNRRLQIGRSQPDPYTHLCHDKPVRLMKCKYCFTELQLDFKKIDTVRKSMFLTVWKDLGEGKSHLDPVWQSHILRRCDPPKVNFELGSISSAFEQDEFKFDSVISRSEEADLMEIDKALYSKNASRARAALAEFFKERKDEYRGEKDPWELYSNYLKYKSVCQD